ncbi:hypothetical protein MMC14_007744 [Varicellaria rhodocarpa]|nr:hypothetical protein [Varicellaria rhodocarpa]
MSKQSAITVPTGYKIQELKDRYIIIRVLEQFLQDNVGEFGSEWRRESLRGIHKVTVKRKLTDEEILALQKSSYPKHFETNNTFED